MNIVLSHVINSAIEGQRFIGTKLFGGSFNGSLVTFGAILSVPLKEPPNNL
jgi:hypothetical protein